MRLITTHRVRSILTSSPGVTIRKARHLVGNRLRVRALRTDDEKRTSYATAPRGALQWRLGSIDAEALPNAGVLAEVCGRYLEHRFDLLGSGWVPVAYGSTARGVEGHVFGPEPSVVPDLAGEWLQDGVNPANASRAATVWSFVSDGYVPIDWQLDFKSGYRWSARTWAPDIVYGDVLGADVKVPWELARMQHLPQLAAAHLATRAAGDGLDPDVYAREIRDEILDFIATNPPRWGVNWTCAMDVAIRAANWLLACDLLASAGTHLGADFEDVLTASLLDHGRFIVDFLEWAPDLRSNHYLSDIVGLAFIAAYLPPTDETDRWLRFAIDELFAETRSQFLADGANFEASTSYHRLSTELVIFGTAVSLGLDASRLERIQSLPPWAPAVVRPRPRHPTRFSLHDERVVSDHLSRIVAAVRFTEACLCEDGRIPQIGDNDSGRLFKLTPAWSRLPASTASALFAVPDVDEAEAYWYDDLLDHRHLLLAVSGLVSGGAPTADAGKRHLLDAAVVRGFAGAPRVAPAAWDRPSAPVGEPQRAGAPATFIIRPPKPIDPPELQAFPDFGLYVWRSPSLYLAVRCGSIGQCGNGGHAHNDQLSFELVLHGEDWAVDPGTYVYTPLPGERNAYRSVRAHDGPFESDAEAGSLDLALFRLGDEITATCLYTSSSCFAGRCDGRGRSVERHITIGTHEIVIADVVDGVAREAATVVSDASELPARWRVRPAYSPGYGVKLRPSGERTWRAIITEHAVGT